MEHLTDNQKRVIKTFLLEKEFPPLPDLAEAEAKCHAQGKSFSYAEGYKDGMRALYRHLMNHVYL